MSDTFTSTTAAAGSPDTTPDAFAFADQSGVALSTVVTSAAVVITGINSLAAISVTGGEYSIGCSAGFTAAGGTIAAGATVRVRHTSSPANSTGTSTALSLGRVSDTFTSTTVAATGGGGGGSGGEGGGGGAMDWWLPGLLAALRVLQRRGLRRSLPLAGDPGRRGTLR